METMTAAQNCAKRRLEMELRDMNENPPTHISFGPLSDDMFQWQGIIMGPVDTPFEGGLFHLSIEFPIDYPLMPPQVKFQTKVYHPNVDQDGTIDINILGEEWSPALTTEKLLLSIISILMNPILEEGNQNQISNLYLHDKKTYNKIAKEWTRQYATG
ncbi:hypothetical protein ACSBR2_030648 [Camellia fascicularis]